MERISIPVVESRVISGIARGLKERRIELGMLSKEAAKKAFLSPSHLTKIERGQQITPLTTIAALANVYNIRIVINPDGTIETDTV